MRPIITPNEQKFLVELDRAEATARQIIADGKLALASYNPNESGAVKDYRQGCFDMADREIERAFIAARDAITFGKDMPTGAEKPLDGGPNQA